jgi:putative peptide zinc metalloprotease protein
VPFAWIDGYWVIADLTGIPDFFAQIKPFPRSNIRGHRWRGSQLSPLKRWVNVVFATHIVITFPVLALMLVLMVSNLPKPVITAWDALLYQRVEFMIARMGGNVWMMFAIIAQALFPPLQLVGVGLILYGVARVPVTLMREALPAWRRLAGATLGATATVLLALAIVWMVQHSARSDTPPDTPPAGAEHFSVPEWTHIDELARYD